MSAVDPVYLMLVIETNGLDVGEYEIALCISCDQCIVLDYLRGLRAVLHQRN